MNIDSYRILISSLPVKQQCFTTKRTTWIKAENEIGWLKYLNDNLFGEQSTLTINRQDIFDTIDLREAIIRTIYWGYTRGMRGNNFINILKHIDLVESALKKIKQIANPTTEDFNVITSNFRNVTGLGLSTYSKLLYFQKLSIDDNPCLILDKRLINVFENKTYSEFYKLGNMSSGNAEKKYLEYLSLMNKLSNSLKTDAENIEQFLFIFGNNLN